MCTQYRILYQCVGISRWSLENVEMKQKFACHTCLVCDERLVLAFSVFCALMLLGGHQEGH